MSSKTFRNLNEEEQDSMLRSLILFNRTATKASREGWNEKALYALIALSDKGMTLSEIKDRFRKITGQDIPETDLRLKLDALLKKRDDNGEKILKIKGLVYQTSSTGAEGRRLRESLDAGTELLIDGAMNRLCRNKTIRLKPTQENKVRGSIKQLLEAYFRQFGYTLFEIKRKPPIEKIKETLGETLTDTGLGKKTDNIIGAVGQLIDKPEEEERAIILERAKAFIAFSALQYDPRLREFTASRFHNNTFWLDTDIILTRMCEKVRRNPQLSALLATLKASGCRIVIARELLAEINDNLDYAQLIHRMHGDGIYQLDEASLETGYGNLFITDFVLKRAADVRDEVKSPIQFREYIRNLRDAEDSTLLDKRLRRLFGNKSITDELLPELDATEMEFYKELLKSTQNTLKGLTRPEDKNKLIAMNDAKLFFHIRRENSRESGLDRKTYLLTDSRRTERCARLNGYENIDIYASVEGLVAILGELGEVTGEYNEVRLLDNPFLVYTAQKIWPDIEKIIDAKRYLKDDDILRLHTDVHSDIHRIVTAQTEVEREAEAERLARRGHGVPRTADELAQEAETARQENLDLKAQNEERKTLLEQKDAEIARLREQLKKSKNTQLENLHRKGFKKIPKGNSSKQRSGRKRRR